jgi:hypothetical protein
MNKINILPRLIVFLLISGLFVFPYEMAFAKTIKKPSISQKKKTSQKKKSSNTSPSSPQLPIYELGNLTLSGNDSLVIQGKNIVINGNIQISENAKLTFRDSQLTIKQDYIQQYSLTVSGNASFEVERVSAPMHVDSTWWMTWTYTDSSKITFNQFKYPGAIWQAVGGDASLNFTNSPVSATFSASSSAKLVAINPDSVWIEMLLPKKADPYHFTLPNGQMWANWNSPVELPYSIQIVNATKIESIDFDIEPGVNVVVTNSQSVKFGWAFHPPYVWDRVVDDTEKTSAITGLKNQYYADNIFSSGEGENLASIRIVNSTIHNWWPVVMNGFILEIDNCTMADPRAYDSNVSINNSSMFMYGSYGNSTVLIKNSTIQDSIIVKDTSFMDLQYVNFSGRITKDPTAKLRRDGAFYP